MIVETNATDPLDVEYDGVKLRILLERDRRHRREIPPSPIPGDTRWRRLTVTQRAAVSAHWSAELRQRIAEAKRGPRIVLDCAEEL